jgi:glucose-6-phosphate isomerase
VGLYASLVNINAYHQPGVEAGKKAAAAVLDLQRQAVAMVQSTEAALSLAELAAKLGAEAQVEILYKVLRHLDANGRSVKLEGNPAQPASLRVTAR